MKPAFAGLLSNAGAAPAHRVGRRWNGGDLAEEDEKVKGKRGFPER